MDDALERGRHEDVDVQLEQLGVGDGVRAGEADDGVRTALEVLEQRGRVQPPGVVDAALPVRHRHHEAAGVVQELRRQAADLAEALHGDRGAAVVHTGLAQRGEGGVHDAAAGRAATPLGAADADRLAGDDAGHRVALVGAERVHHPGHRLLVRADVRGRDVLLRADDRHDLAGVATGHPLELVAAEQPRVDGHAALRAAVRDADERALPRHPHREGADLVHVRVGVEADAALGRAAGEVVLHAVALEDLQRAVVAPQRDRDLHRPAGRREHLVHALVEAELLDRLVELVQRAVERGHACGHARSSLDPARSPLTGQRG